MSFDEMRKKAIEDASNGTILPHRGTPSSSKPNRPQRKAGFYLIDGVDYPSVTTVLGVIAKPALINWAAKQGAKAVLLDPVKYDTPEAAAAAIYDLGGESATERGTVAHKVAEEYAKAYAEGKAEEFTSDNPYFRAIKKFFDTMRPEIRSVNDIEVVLANTKEGYAGTADLIARVGKKLYIVDWKTSKFVYDEYPLQVEAYRRCDLAIFTDGSRLTEQPQMAEAGAVVILKQNGTFTWTETDGDFEAFLAVKRVWQWKQSIAWNGD